MIALFQIKSQATSGFQAFIVHYRDDPDQQNLIDWIQEKWVSELCWSVVRETVTNILTNMFLPLVDYAMLSEK